MAIGVSSSFGFITSSTFSSGRMDFLGRGKGKAKLDNLLAGRGAVLTAGLSLGFLAVTGDDFMGWDCCWAAATTGTTELTRSSHRFGDDDRNNFGSLAEA